MKGSTRITAQKVAALSGVSLTTVSYVLNGRDREMKIAAKTADRVRDVARRVRYRSNSIARSLAKRRTGLIGVVFPDLAGSAAHEIVQGLSETLATESYEMLISVNFWNVERERREVELMLDRQVEGIIALPLVGSEAVYRTAVAARVPVVFVCDWLPKLTVASVAIDSVLAVRELVRHFHATGRRQIHMLAVDWDSACLREREQAFKEELSKLGLPSSSEQIHYSEVGSEDSIRQSVRHFAHRHRNADALLCISDAIAFAAVSELLAQGVQVPERIAIAGIGDQMFARHPLFSLTTVDERRNDIGREAGRQILNLIARKRPRSGRTIRLPGDLKIRGSTAGRSD